jgi:hypothetical protein
MRNKNRYTRFVLAVGGQPEGVFVVKEKNNVKMMKGFQTLCVFLQVTKPKQKLNKISSHQCTY